MVRSGWLTKDDVGSNQESPAAAFRSLNTTQSNWRMESLDAPKLVKYLLDKGYAKVVGRPKMRKSRDVVDLINKELHMGDVIAYSSASTGNGYGQMAMHL